jgi:hypothetical protein
MSGLINRKKVKLICRACNHLFNIRYCNVCNNTGSIEVELNVDISKNKKRD